MPHVKGNKFKPKPAGPQAALDMEAACIAGIPAGDKVKGKRLRRQETQAAAASGSDVAVEEAAPGAVGAASAAPGAPDVAEGVQPSSKKRRRGAAALQLPAIPTVVAPAPRPGAAPAAAAATATSNWAALKAAMDATKQQQQDRRTHWQSRRLRQGGEASGAVGVEPQAAAPVSRPDSIGRDTARTKASWGQGLVVAC